MKTRRALPEAPAAPAPTHRQQPATAVRRAHHALSGAHASEPKAPAQRSP